MYINWLNKKRFGFNSRFKGFSLIELIVVMAIGGVLLGLGLSSIVGLRRQTVVKSGINEFIDSINLASNEARNSFIRTNDLSGIDAVDEVFNRSESLSYRTFFIQEGEFFIGNCEQVVSNVDLERYNCNQSIRDMKGSVSEGSVVSLITDGSQNSYPLNGGVLANNDVCEAIIFAPGSAQATFAKKDTANTNSFYPAIGNGNICFYEFYHETAQNNKTILRLNIDTLEFDII